MKRNTATVSLNIQAQETILQDVYQRRTIEACGVLLGEINEQGNWLVKQAYPLTNTFASPVYFEFAPEQLLEVELNHPGEIIGVYHSHPTGFARASDTDKANMRRVNHEQQIPWAWLIIRGPFDASTLETYQGSIPPHIIIAYHHYPKGLCQLTVELDETKQQSPPSHVCPSD